MPPKPWPGIGYFELQGIAVNTATPDSLGPGQQGRILLPGGLPIWRSPQTVACVPFLNLSVRNYSDMQITVTAGAGSNSIYSVDAKGWGQITDFPYDDILIRNDSTTDTLDLTDIKILCYNDLSSLKNYRDNIKNGVVMPYVRRNQ